MQNLELTCWSLVMNEGMEKKMIAAVQEII